MQWTDSVLWSSEGCVILQSIRNTSIVPTWQFRLWGLLREHKFTYLLTCLLGAVLRDAPVNRSQKLALMRSHLGDVYSSVRRHQLGVLVYQPRQNVGRHQLGVLVYQPRLAQNVRCGVLQLTAAQHIVCVNSTTTKTTTKAIIRNRWRMLPSRPLDNIRVMVTVWRLRGNIIRTAPCWVVWHNVHSQQHTYMSSSYRSSRLGLSRWDPYAMHRGGCLELYYCNMVEWSWWDSDFIWKTN